MAAFGGLLQCARRFAQSTNSHAHSQRTFVTIPNPFRNLFSLGLLAGLALGAADLYAGDVTRPGDPVVPSSANSPNGERAPNAIDNNPATKYLNFDKLNTGFTVTPSTGSSVVRGLLLTSANDEPPRNPTSFTLDGSNDGGTTWFGSGAGSRRTFE